MNPDELIRGYREAGTVRREIMYCETVRLLEQAYAHIRNTKELLAMSRETGRQWRDMYRELRACLGSTTGTSGAECKTNCCDVSSGS